MKTQSLVAFVFSSIVLLATSNAASAGPLELIQDIYGSYPSSESPDDWHKAREKIPSFDDLPLSSVTRSLWVKWNKNNPNEMCIDADPITDSQDPFVQKYRIASFSNSRAVVSLKDKYRKGIVNINFVFKNENGRLVVDEVGGLKAQLQDCLRNGPVAK